MPELEPPGAGLPRGELLFLRKFLFPCMTLITSWDAATKVFLQEGRWVMHLATKVPVGTLGKRVLVPRLQAMEDSSRYWSVEMVVEHLLLVGRIMEDTTILLSKGQSVPGRIRIAAVKPKGGGGVAILSEFEKFVEQYPRRMETEVKDRRSRSTHYHPWLGELTAHQWHCLNGLHYRIHRRQMSLILAGLR